MTILRALLTAIVLHGFGALSVKAEPSAYNRHRDHVLGTSFDLIVMAESEKAADRVEAAMLDEIARLNAVLSNYDENSEVSRLNTSPKTGVSAELMQVLTICESFRERSNNAISCRIGEAISLWSAAEKSDDVPDRARLRIISGEARRAKIVLDTMAGTILRPEPVKFRTDALAKGYIIDKALEAGRKAAPEASGLLLNIGGDQRSWGRGPHDGNWRTGISRYTDRSGASSLSFSNGALATSGIGPRDRVISGEHFGHIISPADGWPVAGKLRASVYAPDAITADALATALMVMNISDGVSMIEEMEGVEATIMADDGRIYKTSGWAALEDMAIVQPSVATQEALSWPEGYQLAVDLEIPDLEVARYERPYVAAWIADADRNLIRILMLAGDEPRWMEENYYWQRRFGRKAGSLVDAISGPTRRPGVYTFVWDGLDDDSKAVPPGDYILHVEAAREHGGHQHVSLDLPLSAGAFTREVSPGDELGAVRVRFGVLQ